MNIRKVTTISLTALFLSITGYNAYSNEIKEPTPTPVLGPVIERQLTQEEIKKLIETGKIEPTIENANEDLIGDTTPYINAKITDRYRFQYQFSRMQGNLEEGILIQKDETFEIDEAYYLINFDKIKELKRSGFERVVVNLRNGHQIKGRWESKEGGYYFYLDNPFRQEYQDVIEGVICGIFNRKPSKIKIKDIDEIIFDELEQKVAESTKKQEIKKYPKKIELTDGTVLEGTDGYICLFNPAWGKLGMDMGLHDSLTTYRGDSPPDSISLERLSEIIFTGKFHKIENSFERDREYRIIIIKKQTSGAETTNLLYPRYSQNENFVLEQDYGKILIPLDRVKKVIPIHK